MVDEGDNILVPGIGYPYYQGLNEAFNFKIKYYNIDKENDFQIDLKDLESKIDEKTKFIYVVNPSNPLGTVFKKSHMIEII